MRARTSAASALVLSSNASLTLICDALCFAASISLNPDPEMLVPGEPAIPAPPPCACAAALFGVDAPPLVADSIGFKPAAVKSRCSLWCAVFDISSIQLRALRASCSLNILDSAFCALLKF